MYGSFRRSQAARSIPLIRTLNLRVAPVQTSRVDKYAANTFSHEIVLQREVTVSNDGAETVRETITVKKTYSPNWSSYNKAQTNERAHFLSSLYELCSGIEEPVQTFGRPRLPLADIIFSATFRTYSTVSGRRFVSELRDALAKGTCQRCRLTIRSLTI
jgi:hypothetical protein